MCDLEAIRHSSGVRSERKELVDRVARSRSTASGVAARKHKTLQSSARPQDDERIDEAIWHRCRRAAA